MLKIYTNPGIYKGVAFCGPIAAGKTTLSQELCKRFKDAKNIPFAEKLKNICIEMYQMDSNPLKKNRTLLQNVGDRMREVDPNVFVNFVMDKVKNANNLSLTTIDDLRFLNEMEKCKNNNILIVYIKVHPEILRERRQKLYPEITPEQLLHKSEKEFETNEAKKYIDVYVNNNNTNEMFDAVDEIVDILINK